MNALVIETFREGYGLEQVRKTMTVGELKQILSGYDEDLPIYLSFDRGYTFGGITEDKILDYTVLDGEDGFDERL